MSALTYIMLCKHEKGTKMKLTAHATWSRYGHRQWLTMEPCCVVCGRIVKSKTVEPE